MPRGGPRAGFGGKQPGAGRPRQRLTLDKEAAKKLHLLTKTQRQFAPSITEEMVLAHIIDEAWQELDGVYQSAAAGQE